MAQSSGVETAEEMKRESEDTFRLIGVGIRGKMSEYSTLLNTTAKLLFQYKKEHKCLATFLGSQAENRKNSYSNTVSVPDLAVGMGMWSTQVWE